MKNFRVSGFIDKIGASQIDIEAENENEAENIAIDDHDFYNVVNVMEI